MRRHTVRKIIKETIEELTACDSMLRLEPESILVPYRRIRNNDIIFIRICKKYGIPYDDSDIFDKEFLEMERLMDSIYNNGI